MIHDQLGSRYPSTDLAGVFIAQQDTIPDLGQLPSPDPLNGGRRSNPRVDGSDPGLEG